MKHPTLALALLLLAACDSTGGKAGTDAAAPADTATAPSPSAPALAPPAQAPAPAAAQVLTAEGYGPLTIGMSRAEVVRAMGEDANPEAVGGPDPESCDEFFPARAPKGLLVMFEEGRLTRISLVRASRVKTDRGLGLGATAAQVRAAYGPALQAGPHKYVNAPAEYLTFWSKHGPVSEAEETKPTARGVRYVVGETGLVEAVIAGGPSVHYVEGCA